MVQWVVEAAEKSGVADTVVVATPDQEIVDCVTSFGGKAQLTSHDHQTGTDRIAEVARSLEAEIYINVQGDEPLMRSASIAACVEPMLSDPSIQMASVYGYCDPSEYNESAVVKVVTDLKGDALYFSRHPIPFERNARLEPVKKHVGLYAFRRETLLKFSTWSMTPLETAESLEQLRFMENGVRIRMSFAEGTELAVDTPEQADQVRKILSARS